MTSNASATRDRLRAAVPRGPQAIGRTLYRIANETMTDSKQHYVPHDRGTLGASGTVDAPVIESNGDVSVRLWFGGPAAAYALAVHEHLSAHSPRSWKRAEAAGHPVRFTQGGPKYLERPVAEHTRDLPIRVATAWLQAMRGETAL